MGMVVDFRLVSRMFMVMGSVLAGMVMVMHMHLRGMAMLMRMFMNVFMYVCMGMFVGVDRAPMSVWMTVHVGMLMRV